MKRAMVFACLGMWLVSAPAFAGPQQEKMKSCNREAKEKALKGDARKAFMKTCLRGNEDAIPEGKAGQASGKK